MFDNFAITIGKPYTQIEQANQERAKLRHDQLALIEWKPLWAKPAIFAAALMVLFVLIFKDENKAAEFG